MAIVHVNVPYSMLLTRTHFAVENRIHPEIFFSANDLDTYQETDAKHLAEVLYRHDLEITFHAPFMDLSPGGVDQKIKEVTLDRFSRVINLAQFFKPKTIVFHPGYDKWKFNGNVELWLKSSLQTWEPLVEEAEVKGLTLAIENIFEESPEPLALLLQAIPSRHFRFCFDTGHHHIFNNVPLSLWFEALADDLCEVHLHDNHRGSDEHLPIGEGGFDFDAFFSLLSSHNLHPIYTIEPHEEEHLFRGLEAVKKYIK